MDKLKNKPLYGAGEFGSKNLKKNFLHFMLTFILSFAPISGAYPFGTALFCAAEKYTLPYFFGNIACSVFMGATSVSTIFANIFVLFAKWYLKDRKEAPLFLRWLVSFLAASLFIIGAVAGKDESTAKALAGGVSVPIITLFFFGFSIKNSPFGNAHRDAAIICAAFAAALAVSRVQFGIFSLPLVIASAATLCAGKFSGFIFGGIAGFVSAFACGVAAIPALGIAGLISGLVFVTGEKIACTAFTASAICAYAYFASLDDIPVLLFNIGIALCVFACVSRYIPKKPLAHAVCGRLTAEKSVKRDVIIPMADAFTSLSGTFYSISEAKKKDRAAEIRKRICAATDKVCRDCTYCTIDICELQNTFNSVISARGALSECDCPSYFLQECKAHGRMIREVNKAVLSDDTNASNIGMLAGSCAAFAGVLESGSRKSRERTSNRRTLSQQAFSALEAMGITADKITVRGRRKIELEAFGVTMINIACTSKDITARLSKVCGCALSEPEFILNDGYAVMKLNAVPCISAEYAKAVIAKSGEKVCGDTVSFFENDDNYFYSLVSDGMGSGKDAALSSRLASIVLEKLLTAGADMSGAVSMLNSVLVANNEEVFTTIDLLEIDMISAAATFIKAGAAPTYLIRNNILHRIESKTLPAGIIAETVAEQTKLTLAKGDYIIMMSDGVLGETEDERWLYAIAESGRYKSPHILAAHIADTSRRMSKSNDDLSVCAIKIS